MRRSISLCSGAGVSEAYIYVQPYPQKPEEGKKTWLMRRSLLSSQLELQFRLSSVFPSKNPADSEASDIKITPTPLQDRPDYGLLCVGWVLTVR
jgi:hypothetical protein